MKSHKRVDTMFKCYKESNQGKNYLHIFFFNLETIVFHPPLRRRIKWFLVNPMKISLIFSTIFWTIFFLSGYTFRHVDELIYRKSVEILRRLMYEEKSIEDIITSTKKYAGLSPYTNIKPQQNVYEIKHLALTVQKNSPKTVLEIGTAEGGTLYIWSRTLKSCKTLISMDLPRRIPNKKKEFYRQFNNKINYEFIEGDSHSIKTVNKLSNILKHKKIDFIFIDGDHSYEGVKKDYENYKSFLSVGGIIAFHDIKSRDFNVRKFWNEIKNEYHFKEIISPKEDDSPGIGILYL